MKKLTEKQYLKQRGLQEGDDYENISPNAAREILHAKSINGKPLTDEQRKLFGFLSKGNTKKYKGGGNIYDDNGYLSSNLDNYTPSKIINSNHITTQGMAFPIEANGVPLYPNTGDYIFPSKQVKEVPMKKKGGKIKFQQGTYDEFQNKLWGDQNQLAPINPNAIQPIANPNYDSTQAVAMPKVETISTEGMTDPSKTNGGKKPIRGYSGPSIGLGTILQGGIGLTSMLLGPDKPRKRIDNTLAYNPYPSGTGSSALYQEGGNVYPSTNQINDFSDYAKTTDTKVMTSKLINKGLKTPNNLITENQGEYTNGNQLGSMSSWVPNATTQILARARAKNIKTPEGITANQEYLKNNSFKESLNNPTFNQNFPNYWETIKGLVKDQYKNETSNTQVASLKKGGSIKKYNFGGLQTFDGGSAPQVSQNPFDGGMGEFKGDSHVNGGIESAFNGKPFEAEGGEPYRIDAQGSLEIFGDLDNPVTGNKFKKDGKIIANKEKKVQKYVDKGLDLVNNTEPTKDKWEKLKFNSGTAMLKGGLFKQKELAESKEHLSLLQKIMLEQEGEQQYGKHGGIFQKGGNPDKDNYKALLKKYSDLYGVNYSTLEKIVNTESGFNHNQTSNVGAKGIMQFMPKTASSYGLTENSSIEDNIKAGVRHFASLLKQNHGDEKLATAAYNMGQGNLNKFITSSGKKKSEYTGEDLMNRLEWKSKNQPSSKKNLAQNQTKDYLKNIFGTESNPEKFREEYYAPTINPSTGKDYTFGNNFRPKGTPKTPTPYPENTPIDFKQPDTVPFKPQNRRKPWEQIAPAIPQIFDTPDFVERTSYQPELYTPYQVSFQDRINQNSKTFNALGPSLVNNPEAQGVLAGQLYSANESVLGDEFRTNQGISNDITNKNVSLLNDAKLKNIQLADTQYVRQAQAKSNTEDRRTAAGIQIGDVLAKNNLENKTLDVYQQLYKDYAFDRNNQLQYVGTENGGDRIDDNVLTLPLKTSVTTTQGNTRTSSLYGTPPSNTITPVQLLDNYGKRRRTFKKGGALTQSSIAKLMFS